MAISDIPPSLMAFPYEPGITRRFIGFTCMDEGCVPAPAIGAGQPHTAFKQVYRRFIAHAAARGDIVVLPIALACRRINHDDFERLQRVADARELGLDIGSGHDIAIGQRCEIKLHAGLKTPIKRDFINRDRALALIHR